MPSPATPKKKTPAKAEASAKPATTAPTRTGVVESDKRDKTRKVVVSYLAQHPKYGKYVRQRTVLHVHDEKNQSKLGDLVEVAECRPISKTKSWKLVRIVEKRAEVTAALNSVREIDS